MPSNGRGFAKANKALVTLLTCGQTWSFLKVSGYRLILPTGNSVVKKTF